MADRRDRAVRRGRYKAIAQLRETVFKGRTIKTLQPAPDGKGFAVMEW